jgi:hypothetical protein
MDTDATGYPKTMRIKTMVATQSQTRPPLTEFDRQLIAQIVNRSDYPNEVGAHEIVTIRVNDGVVWVQLYKCWVAFDFDWFKTQVAELKSQLPNHKTGTRLQPKPKCLQPYRWYYQESLVMVGRIDRSSFWVHDCRIELGILVDGWEEAKALRKHLLSQPQHWLLVS